MNHYISKKTKALNNLVTAANKTSGCMERVWIDKWYEMIHSIAKDLTSLEHNSATNEKVKTFISQIRT